MLRAADYRERARASLSGNWGMAVLVCFVGALLGGIQSVIPVTANYQYGEGMSVQIFGINMSLNQLPAEMLGILAVMMSILSIYALAQFVIGGVVELGMCAYFSNVHWARMRTLRMSLLISSISERHSGFVL